MRPRSRCLSRASSRVSSSAWAVADRGWSSNRPISPKHSPGASVDTNPPGAPAPRIEMPTFPEAMMYIRSLGSPSSKTNSPA